MTHIAREPLLHFVLIAALLLGLNSLWTESRKPLVELSAASYQAQIRNNEERLGRPLNQEERKRLQHEMLIEEILFHEAQQRGLVSDNSVRKSLIAMMRSALKPMPLPPTDEDLLKLQAQIPAENTTLPAEVSFEHVSFAKLENVPADLLAKLRNGADHRNFGEPVRLANPLPLTYRPQLERILGEEFTKQIFTVPTDTWQGPLLSTRGAHLVRIVKRSADQPMSMEQTRPILLAKWRELKEAESVSAEVEKLMVNYRIRLPQE